MVYNSFQSGMFSFIVFKKTKRIRRIRSIIFIRILGKNIKISISNWNFIRRLTKRFNNWNFIKRITKILTKRRSTQGKGIRILPPKTNTTKITNITCIITDWKYVWKSVKKDWANCQLTEPAKQQIKFKKNMQ